MLRYAIHKSIRHSNEIQSEADKMRIVEQFQSTYLLKVAGSDQYFLQNCQISQYKYIRQCLAKMETPHLMLMSKERVYNSLPNSDFRMPSWLRRPYTPSNAGNTKMDSLWRVNHSFRLHVQSASRVNVKDVDLIYVRVGLYHGTEPLCPEKQSKQVTNRQVLFKRTRSLCICRLVTETPSGKNGLILTSTWLTCRDPRSCV